MPDETAEAVAETYRLLGTHGFCFGGSGNVSCRTATGMLITRSGVTVDKVEASDIVATDREGRPLGNGKPSSECFMHAEIYAAYPQARAVIHSHSDACTALACLGEGLPAFHYMVVGFGGSDVRCAPYTTFGTPELGRLAVEALRDRSACLLANHGMICHGSSLRDAFLRAQRLETLSRQYLLARSAGVPRILTAEEIAAAIKRYETYG
ncbi:class II aldolase/adducin family protein [Rhodoligotrophos defluvii]|uniref:class II aldolase/adducin family protein n=1 Tax=Rhodoligotrophos defluvii TaxID=2561934 RepID=UPI0010C96EC8|nr:class II aldolase/adducin family protein [Rhodoligotrophos defluvii]